MRTLMAAIFLACVIGGVIYFRKWVSDASDDEPPGGAA